jgi:hypothetical protein
VTTLERARLQIEPWPTCRFCGCRYTWVLHLDAADPGVLLGCVRTYPLAEMLRIARRELARRSA